MPLGEQVRRAVEVLIQTLDKADQDRNRELLHDVKEPELYEARADGDDAPGVSCSPPRSAACS